MSSKKSIELTEAHTCKVTIPREEFTTHARHEALFTKSFATFDIKSLSPNPGESASTRFFFVHSRKHNGESVGLSFSVPLGRIKEARDLIIP